MPWRTLCGFPPTAEPITLRIPNGAWRPDTVITDTEGNEMFVLLDQTNEMRSYEAVFGDLDGRRLVCIKRHLSPQFWKDGYYLCTYTPNYPNQVALADRDADNKRVYPFSYLQITAMKGRFFYRLFNNDQTTGPPRLVAENPWLGFMVVCCTPSVRLGKWCAKFKKTLNMKTTIQIDQWRNCVHVGVGNDLLAALCMAYIFDRYQCQPLITVFGRSEEDEYENIEDNSSIESDKIEHQDNDDEQEFDEYEKNNNNTNNENDEEQPLHAGGSNKNTSKPLANNDEQSNDGALKDFDDDDDDAGGHYYQDADAATIEPVDVAPIYSDNEPTTRTTMRNKSSSPQHDQSAAAAAAVTPFTINDQEDANMSFKMTDTASTNNNNNNNSPYGQELEPTEIV